MACTCCIFGECEDEKVRFCRQKYDSLLLDHFLTVKEYLSLWKLMGHENENSFYVQ